jgi:hypothetical protein
MRIAATARRRLLACVAAGMPTVVAFPSLAFRAEPMDGPEHAAYAAEACAGASGLHDVLRAELASVLGGQPVPEALRRDLEALARCPWCGCAVLGTVGGGGGKDGAARRVPSGRD